MKPFQKTMVSLVMALAVMWGVSVFFGEPPAAYAAGTFQLSGDRTGSYESLQSALDAISSHTGTNYAITCSADATISDRALNILKNKNVTIKSDSATEKRTFTRTAHNNGRNNQIIRHFDVGVNGGNSHLTLENIVLEGPGSQSIGGGIHAYNSSVTLTNVAIRNCSTSASGYGGGGISVSGSDLTLNSGTVIENCFVPDTNLVGGGGILALEGSTVIVNEGTIIQNNTVASTSGKGGGGICMTGRNSLTLNGAKIQNNTSNSNGGGVYTESAFELNGSVITGNTSGRNGGGIALSASANLTVTGPARILDNKANRSGNDTYTPAPDYSNITVVTDDASKDHEPVPTAVPDTIPVTSMTMSHYQISFTHSLAENFINNTSVLKATVYPEKATNKQLIWTSSDPTLMKVDQNGRLSFPKPSPTPHYRAGILYITATAADGSGLSVSCKVFIYNLFCNNRGDRISPEKFDTFAVPGPSSVSNPTGMPDGGPVPVGASNTTLYSSQPGTGTPSTPPTGMPPAPSITPPKGPFNTPSTIPINDWFSMGPNGPIFNWSW